MAVPQLPADLLFLIFGELSTEERTPLETSCKRFREIDFDIGKKIFGPIAIELLRMPKTMRVSGTSAGREYVIHGPVESTYHNQRLFRKAKTDALKISINCDSTDLASLHFISSFFDRTQFYRLDINANCDQSACEYLISMTKHRNLADSQVSLNLSIPRDSPGSDISQARSMLTQLSRINHLKLNGGIFFRSMKRIFTDTLIDDAALHHFVTNSTHAELGKADCSLQGILSAFQVFCDSKTYKYAVVDIPKAWFDHFFYVPNLAYERCVLPDGQWAVFDRASSAVLAGPDPRDLTGVYLRVEMGKVDDQYALVRKEVKWF